VCPSCCATVRTTIAILQTSDAKIRALSRNPQTLSLPFISADQCPVHCPLLPSVYEETVRVLHIEIAGGRLSVFRSAYERRHANLQTCFDPIGQSFSGAPVLLVVGTAKVPL
jgi:hypothetical protein